MSYRLKLLNYMSQKPYESCDATFIDIKPTHCICFAIYQSILVVSCHNHINLLFCEAYAWWLIPASNKLRQSFKNLICAPYHSLMEESKIHFSKHFLQLFWKLKLIFWISIWQHLAHSSLRWCAVMHGRTTRPRGILEVYQMPRGYFVFGPIGPFIFGLYLCFQYFAQNCLNLKWINFKAFCLQRISARPIEEGRYPPPHRGRGGFVRTTSRSPLCVGGRDTSCDREKME